jgi:hypothetical protein
VSAGPVRQPGAERDLWLGKLPTPMTDDAAGDGWSREAAVDRLDDLVDTIESERMPVPVREVWVTGDLVLGVDPVERLEVYLTKDLLFKDAPERDEEFRKSHGVQGVGKTVSAAWADEHPEHLRANANGHAAPEKCLAAHLFGDSDEPVHLEVCNTGFENNVTQRLRGARAREDYTQLLDPRAACLWVQGEDGGVRSDEAFRKLREGEFVFPTLSKALEMLEMDPEEAEAAAAELRAHRRERDGRTVRGDVV